MLYKKGRLQRDWQQRLEETGFVWDYTEYYWNSMYENAKNYYEKHGHLHVSSNHVCENGAKLGQWISSMRRRRKYKEAGKAGTNISQEQINMLDSIGMIWEIK